MHHSADRRDLRPESRIIGIIIVHVGTKRNCLGFQVKRLKVKVPAIPGAQQAEAYRA